LIRTDQLIRNDSTPAGSSIKASASEVPLRSAALLVSYINRKVDRLIDWMESLANR
jgi:hypothetical protein